jgi:L-threonylcarbamoyladenylate synthase
MVVIDCNSLVDSKLYFQDNGYLEILANIEIINKIIKPCIEVLNQKGAIVYPTDTIYALGVNAFDSEAVSKVPDLKKRSQDMPISVAVADFEMFDKIVVTNEIVRKIYNEFLPGGLTLLLDINPDIEPEVSHLIRSKSNKIGVRVPNHNLTLTLIKQFGKPITTTSANIHNMEPPVEFSTAVNQFGDNIDVYLNCGTSPSRIPSTIVEITSDGVNIIREGAISRTQLASKLEVQINDR